MAKSHIAEYKSINQFNIQVIVPTLKTVVFGHHPCPDGIAAIVCLAEKFGNENTHYYGLNHAKLEDMQQRIFSIVSSDPVNIIFVDIIPPFEILKELLEKTQCTVTLLDHHPTAKVEIDKNVDFFNQFMNENPPRLQIDIDLKRSGVGIAYDFVHGKKERPAYISLVQAIDLLTATANYEFIQQFDAKALCLNSQSQEMMKKLSALTTNDLIKSNIDFYVFAAIFDIQMKKFFKENNNEMNSALISAVTEFFNFIKLNGLNALLQNSFSDAKDQARSIEALFREQITYQTKALNEAKLIPSLIDDKMDILFIEADIQTGRTFDPLIAQKLVGLSRPTIAMIANTKTISDNNNWVNLRAADNAINLFDIAYQYKSQRFAANAGGHPRASALQLSREQILKFINMAKSEKKPIHYRFLLTSLDDISHNNKASETKNINPGRKTP